MREGRGLLRVWLKMLSPGFISLALCKLTPGYHGLCYQLEDFMMRSILLSQSEKLLQVKQTNSKHPVSVLEKNPGNL